MDTNQVTQQSNLATARELSQEVVAEVVRDLPADEHPGQATADEQAAGLRALADMIQANPDLTATKSYLGGLAVWNAKDAEFMAKLARAALRHGAKVTKDIGGKMFNLVLDFGAVKAQILAYRDDVCERVVVGTREVAEEVPDPDALAAVPTTTVTRTEDIVEWQCKPLLAADTEAVKS